MGYHYPGNNNHIVKLYFSYIFYSYIIENIFCILATFWTFSATVGCLPDRATALSIPPPEIPYYVITFHCQIWLFGAGCSYNLLWLMPQYTWYFVWVFLYLVVATTSYLPTRLKKYQVWMRNTWILPFWNQRLPVIQCILLAYIEYKKPGMAKRDTHTFIK